MGSLRAAAGGVIYSTLAGNIIGKKEELALFISFARFVAGSSLEGATLSANPITQTSYAPVADDSS